MHKLPKIHQGTAWEIKDTDSKITEHLSKTYPVAFAKVMCNRGLYEVSAVEAFLKSGLESLPLRKIKEGLLANAAERVLNAIVNHEKILVYGDYDVDGVTSTALVTDIIRQLGGEADYFIPNRKEDGYGLTPKKAEELADQGVKLVITVDCGINAVEEVRILKERGVDTIITDHHEPQVDQEADLFICNGLNSYLLPEAYSVINPKIEGPAANADAPGYCNLAGVGVAFMLCWSLVNQAKKRRLERVANFRLDKYLDLVALGTIADVVPLKGQNRIFVKHGLKALRHTTRPGLKKLIEKSGISDCQVNDVTFQLAPRLNAPGRMSDASLAVELMLTPDASNGEVIVDELENANKERQRVEKETFKEAMAAFEATLPVKIPAMPPKLPGGLKAYCKEGPGIVVAAGENWNPGVVGIVASRMMERYGLPAIVIAMNGDTGKGSCRSCGSFHMFEALRRCSDLLEAYGGHHAAAGLSVRRENLPALRERLDRIARETPMKRSDSPQTLMIDAVTTLRELDERLVNLVSLCEPHGPGNPHPAFLVRKVRLAEEPQLINDKHIKFLVTQDGSCYCKVMAFNWKNRFEELISSPELDLVVYPYLNEYRNSSSVELQLIDLKPSIRDI